MAYDSPLSPPALLPLTGNEIVIVYQNGVPKRATAAEVVSAVGTTGTGVFVLQNQPTINGPVINTLTEHGPLTVFNENGAASIYGQSQSNNGQPVHGAFGMLQIAAQGWDGTQFSYDASLYFRAVDTFTPTAHGTEMLFFTTPSGTTTTVTGAGVYADGSLWSGGTTPLANNATGPFFGLPTMAGAPTGVPAVPYASAAVVYDTTNNLLNVYNAGWHALATQGQPSSFTTLNVTGVATLANGAVLGTPASINLANATNLPNTGLAGPFTGTGALVRQTSPTITGLTVTGGVGTDTLTATGNVSGAALLPTGAAAPPAGSPGFFRQGANTLGIATNGLARWYVDQNGVLSNYAAAVNSGVNAGGLVLTGATGLTNNLQVGFNAGLTAGNAVSIYGNATNGGVCQIGTNYMSADGPLQVGTYTSPNALTIAVNGLVTAPRGLSVNTGFTLQGVPARGVVVAQAGAAPVTVTGAGTAGQPLLSGGASADPAFGLMSTAALSDRDATATAFTPTFSFATMGDAVFSGVTANGQYRRLGFLVIFQIRVTFTATFTTAAGALIIGGFPLTPSNSWYCGAVFPWPQPASPYNFLIGQLASNGLTMLIQGTNYTNNYWGPTYGLVSGQQYGFSVGGVYATNS